MIFEARGRPLVPSFPCSLFSNLRSLIPNPCFYSVGFGGFTTIHASCRLHACVPDHMG
jgi:hypothetical protein